MARLNQRTTEKVIESIDGAPIKRGDIVYYAQILRPPVGEFNVLELCIHNVNMIQKYFTGCETRGNKHTYLFNLSELDKYVFIERKDALKKVKAAEKEYKDYQISDEKEYEEY